MPQYFFNDDLAGVKAFAYAAGTPGVGLARADGAVSYGGNTSLECVYVTHDRDAGTYKTDNGGDKSSPRERRQERPDGGSRPEWGYELISEAATGAEEGSR